MYFTLHTPKPISTPGCLLHVSPLLLISRMFLVCRFVLSSRRVVAVAVVVNVAVAVGNDDGDVSVVHSTCNSISLHRCFYTEFYTTSMATLEAGVPEYSSIRIRALE